jgi:hypothetical protein
MNNDFEVLCIQLLESYNSYSLQIKRTEYKFYKNNKRIKRKLFYIPNNNFVKGKPNYPVSQSKFDYNFILLYCL